MLKYGSVLRDDRSSRESPPLSVGERIIRSAMEKDVKRTRAADGVQKSQNERDKAESVDRIAAKWDAARKSGIADRRY